MADFNFAFPDIPYMENREMYDYFFLIDRTLREMGRAINTLSHIDPEAIAKLVMPKADGVSIRDIDNVWSVIRSPYASISGEADKLSTARTITIAGDATGSTTFDGSSNVDITLNVTEADHATSANSAASAGKLTTARTITLTGDTTGVASFDGSSNVNLTTSTGVATKLRTPRTISITGDATGSTTFDGSANSTINLDVTSADHATTADSATNTSHATSADTATSATKLATPRTITLTGDTTGSTTFDGSANVSIATTTTHSKASDTASKATNADLATRAQVADKLSSERLISLSGDVTGSAGFDGSKDVTMTTEISSEFKSSISDIISIDYANKVAIPVKAAEATYTMPGNGWLQVASIGNNIPPQCIILSLPNIGGYGQSPYAAFMPPTSGGGMGGLIKVRAGDSIVVRILDNGTASNREIWFIPEKGASA